MAAKDTESHPTDTNTDWLTPRQAIAILDAAFDQRSSVSKEALLQCLRGRQIDAMSFKTLFSPENRSDQLVSFYRIPAEDWDRVQWNDGFFGNGILAYRRRIYGDSRYEEVRHFNVRFNPEHVKAIAAPYQVTQGALSNTPSAPNHVVAPHRGGAPKKEWWDDFWIEICRQ